MRSCACSNTRTLSTIPIIWGIISRIIVAKTLCLLFICELAEVGVCLRAGDDVSLDLETSVVGIGVALCFLEGGHT
jgi:hypothetical protein